MRIQVECYAGYRGEETPRTLCLGTRRVGVVSVTDRWLAPDHRYFRLVADDGGLYIVRHNSHRDLWELTFYKAIPDHVVHSPQPYH